MLSVRVFPLKVSAVLVRNQNFLLLERSSSKVTVLVKCVFFFSIRIPISFFLFIVSINMCASVYSMFCEITRANSLQVTSELFCEPRRDEKSSSVMSKLVRVYYLQKTTSKRFIILLDYFNVIKHLYY